MTAREDLATVLVNGGAATNALATGLIDAYRAEVLREAEAKAREVVAKLWGGGVTQQQLDRTDGARAVELEIGLLAAGQTATTAPDFFQPDHSYTRYDGTTFQCFTVTTTPWNGRALAIGWHTDEADITSIAWRGIDAWRHEYDGVSSPTEPGDGA